MTVSLVTQGLSAAAVVLSLIFVGLEVRESSRQTEQNTLSLQAGAYQELLAQIMSLNLLSMQSPGVNRPSNASSFRELTPIESEKEAARHLFMLRYGDLAYYQYELGMLSPERLESALGIFNDSVCEPLSGRAGHGFAIISWVAIRRMSMRNSRQRTASPEFETRIVGIAHREESSMAAFNIVRFRVKPGLEEAFVDAHRQIDRSTMAGFKRGSLVKTGDQQFCFIGEWEDFSNIENAREDMVGILDRFRDMLEDLGDGLGVTDPVSGEVVLSVE